MLTCHSGRKCNCLMVHWYTWVTYLSRTNTFGLHTVKQCYSWPGALLIGGSDRGSHTVIWVLCIITQGESHSDRKSRNHCSHCPAWMTLTVFAAKKWAIKKAPWQQKRTSSSGGWIHFIVFYEEVKREGGGMGTRYHLTASLKPPNARHKRKTDPLHLSTILCGYSIPLSISKSKLLLDHIPLFQDTQ